MGEVGRGDKYRKTKIGSGTCLCMAFKIIKKATLNSYSFGLAKNNYLTLLLWIPPSCSLLEIRTRWKSCTPMKVNNNKKILLTFFVQFLNNYRAAELRFRSCMLPRSVTDFSKPPNPIRYCIMYCIPVCIASQKFAAPNFLLILIDGLI